jgi:hypothetical protein
VRFNARLNSRRRNATKKVWISCKDLGNDKVGYLLSAIPGHLNPKFNVMRASADGK